MKYSTSRASVPPYSFMKSPDPSLGPPKIWAVKAYINRAAGSKRSLFIVSSRPSSMACFLDFILFCFVLFYRRP